MKRIFIYVAVALVAVFSLACQSAERQNDGAATETNAAPNAGAKQAPTISHKDSVATRKSTTLAFTGDIMMGTSFPDASTVTRDRGKSLFKDCDSILQKADVAIGNLEGTCFDDTTVQPRKKSGPTTYIFRMPSDHLQNLLDAGFDAMGTANNHAGDFGQEGRRQTQRNLEKAGLKSSGQKGLAEAAIIERNGVKYGYLSFASSCANTLDMQDSAARDALIKKLRPECDVLIVTFHGGAEGAGHTHVPFQKETFLGENRGDVHKFAHECIDLGADIVVGHGPHVPRAMELYNGHLIAYSLGNFCTPYRVSLGGVSGQAPLLTVSLDTQTGKFLSGHIYSFLQTRGVGPRRDAANTVAHTIASLTQQDFPSTPLQIDGQGEMSVKK